MVEVLWSHKAEYLTDLRSQPGGPGALLAEGKMQAVERLINLDVELRNLDEAVLQLKEEKDAARKSETDDGY